MGFEIRDPNKVAAEIKDLGEKLSIGNRVIVDVRRHPFEVKIDFWQDKEQMAGFTLIQQPNCCGVVISTGTFVREKFRKQGLGQSLMPLKEAIARTYGYSCLAATVNVTGNPAEVHILTKFHWKEGYRFVNQRTKNTVGFFFKTL